MAKFFMVLTISIVILLLSGTIVLLVAAILNPPIYSYPVNSSSNMVEQSVHEASIKDATCNGNIKLLQAYPINTNLIIIYIPLT